MLADLYLLLTTVFCPPTISCPSGRQLGAVRSPPHAGPPLVMHTARSISADQTVAVLAALVAARGAPTYIRCDNGPEVTANALIDWCASQRTANQLHRPGRAVAETVR